MRSQLPRAPPSAGAMLWFSWGKQEDRLYPPPVKVSEQQTAVQETTQQEETGAI